MVLDEAKWVVEAALAGLWKGEEHMTLLFAKAGRNCNIRHVTSRPDMYQRIEATQAPRQPVVLMIVQLLMA